MPLPFFAMTALLKLAYILVDTIRIVVSKNDKELNDNPEHSA